MGSAERKLYNKTRTQQEAEAGAPEPASAAHEGDAADCVTDRIIGLSRPTHVINDEPLEVVYSISTSFCSLSLRDAFPLSMSFRVRIVWLKQTQNS